MADSFRDAVVGLLAEHTNVSRSEISAKIEVPSDDLLGDYAFPCFFLAKELKKSPVAIATETASRVNDALASAKEGIIERAHAAGPYINFFVNKAGLAATVLAAVEKEKGGYGGSKNGKIIMVEYFHANTHKAVHIGHVRNICLGESLCRILEFSGNKIVRVNYQGDIGPHVAKCIWGIQNLNLGAPPAINRLRWLGNVYVQANTAVEGNEKLEADVKQLLLRIYAGDKELNQLWKETRQWCLEEFDEMYKDFGVKHDEFYFESEVEFEARKISQQLLKEGIAQESDGAIIMDLKPYKLGVFILLTRDGTALYSSKDIALARKKMSKYSLDRSIHVVGREQELHFKQLFKTLSLMGEKERQFAEKSHHLIYGLVMLPTGKMSSRAGSVVFYDDLRSGLIELATEEVKKRHADWEEKKVADAAKKIAFAALKFGMINRDNDRELVFDWEQAVKLEGETGPYLQYAYARICSVFRKYGKVLPGKIKYSGMTTSAAEVNVIKFVKIFPDIVAVAAEQLKPALLSRYLLDLAQSFNNFYNDCQILGAEPDVRDARLLLCAAVKQVLENGLRLLAIDVLDEM
ncbi:TPA: arginine--tRNA ligase [Candidatus Woesearchaeota archaeon]|nr:arginine--tRNA ligase [Candidatus Woesearchaeota archaeon]